MDADAVIIGGGVLGSSVALGLTQRSFGSVVVVDVDLSGELASSTLNVGGVRATWWWPVNIELSLRSLEYFWSIREEIQYRRLGYLWLYDEKRWPAAKAAVSRQNGYGLGIQTLTPLEVADRVKEIDCLDGLAGATFSPLDGLVNSVLIKQHYQREARTRGAEFLDRWFVTGIVQEGSRWRVAGHAPKAGAAVPLLVDPPGSLTVTDAITAKVVVNAGGAWAPRIARFYGDILRSTPQRRQVFYVRHPRLCFEGHGLIVDTSGAFIQPLGEQVLCGYANPDEPASYKFDWDGRRFYDCWVAPPLAQRMAAFADAEIVGGWARLYDNSPDRSGIVGDVPARPGLYQIHSFSGHGVMQSYAAGQALAELIVRGTYEEWRTAAALGPGRFARGAFVYETLYI